MKTKRYYTITEAAKRLRVSRPAVFEAIKEGRLKAKLAEIRTRVWQVDHESLQQYEVSLSHQVRGKKTEYSLMVLS